MKRRPWWKRLLIALGALVLLLIAFHRPLIFAAVKLAAHRVGPSQGLDIDFQIHGTIFTGLTIQDLKITPTRPGAIERCNVGLLEAHYSLIALARGGLSSDFIRSVTVHDADVVYDPSKSPPSPPKKKEPFQLPPLPLPQQLSLRNINFLMRAAPKDVAQAQGAAASKSSAVPAPAAPAVAASTAAVVGEGLLISKLNLDLNPDQPGEFEAAELRIPGGPDLQKIAATTSYKDRDLKIMGLELAPEIRLRTVEFDASALNRELLKIGIEGDLFAGRANVAVQLRGLGKPPMTDVAIAFNGLSLGSVRDFLKLTTPLSGTVENASVKFTGYADAPRSWVGDIDGRVAGLVAGETGIDSIDWTVRIRDGNAKIDRMEAAAGENYIGLTANAELPAKMEDLPRSTARGKLSVDMPDFAKLPVKTPQEIAGALRVRGDFTLAGGKFSTSLKGHVQALSVPAQQAAVSGLDFALDASKVLPPDATAPPPTPGAPPPPDKPFFDGLQTRLAASVNEIQFTQYRVDAVKVTVSTDQAAVRVEELSVERGDNKLALNGTYELPADFNRWQEKPLALHLKLGAPALGQFSADQTAAPLRGKLSANADVAMTGGEYSGQFNVAAAAIEAAGARIDSVDLRVGIANNRATIQSGEIRLDPKNTVSLEGTADLKAPYHFTGGAKVALTDLGAFEPLVNQKIGGTLSIVAQGSGESGAYEGKVNIAARDIAAHGATIQSVDVQATAHDNQAVIERGEVRIDAKSGLTFGGKAGLQSPFPYEGNLDLNLPDLGAFEGILRANGVNEKLGGSIRLTGQAKGSLPTHPGATDQTLDAAINLTALNLQAAGAKIERVDGQITADKNLALIKTLQIRFDAKNTIDLAGQAATQAPFDYRANLNVNLTDLKSFEPILRAQAAKAPPIASEKAAAMVEGTPKPKEINAPARKGSGARTASSKPAPITAAPEKPPEPKLAGAISVQWQAAGNLAKDPAALTYTGGGKVAVRKVEFNAIGPVEADIAGDYSPTAINFPTLTVNTNGIQFGATIGLANNLLRVDKIALKQGAADLLAGYLQLPVDLKKLSAPEGPVPDTDQIDVNIASKPINLQTLFAALDKSKPAPAAGDLNLSVLAHGRLSKILAEIKVAARKVRMPSQLGFAPADADVALTLRDDRLSLDTSVRQPQIQTLTVKGNIPLPLQTVLSTKTIDPKSPIALTIQLPKSDLGFLAKVAPSIRFIQGSAGADIRVGGTVEHPTFAGSANVNVPAARMQDVTVPSVRDFQANLAFTEKSLRIERFTGEIGGGKLNVAGGVDFPNIKAPTLNLAITADNVLAARDDNLTARVNANIHITGPLATATVAGSVGITKSRYLKEIDIVPIGMPGKPPPSTPAPAESEPSVSIGVAPVKDWKFDLAIKTDDPFLVRGNLANGQATVDLRLRGTGLKPLLDGNVTVNNLTASLPFSTLEIDNGNISFTPDQPLNPVIDLRGTSTIRTYLVTVYISGRAHDPKIVFSSEPPLAQEQIVSLLATGATTDELAGNTEALAGKATLLVLQDLYRRTFKKKPSSSRAAEPRETLADKVNLDLGSVDPRTGKQEVSARFKVNDKVSFIGELGIEGDIQGRLRYLVRFR